MEAKRERETAQSVDTMGRTSGVLYGISYDQCQAVNASGRVAGWRITRVYLDYRHVANYEYARYVPHKIQLNIQLELIVHARVLGNQGSPYNLNVKKL